MGGGNRNQSTDFGEEEDSVGQQDVLISAQAKKVLALSAIFLPVILVVILIVVVIAAIGGVTGDYEDAIAAYAASGGDTGGVVYEPSSDQAKAFYDRIDEAKSSMESEGEELDIIKFANYITTKRFKLFYRIYIIFFFTTNFM